MEMKRNVDLGLLILRVSLSFILMFHGVAKLRDGVSFITNLLSEKGLPEFIAYGSYFGELIAPFLVLLGYRTKLFAGFIAGNMFVVIYLAHMNELFTLNQYGGWAVELPALFFFGALSLMFTGGGKFAVSSKSILD
ncbi:DoxX family protein [Aureibacter tunicatorum]|uniref:Oxidoreductase n=1 Tax=Aureibacter tunicatorum TaxID=866807 RepID=A0AAE3XSQ8_9BACT|nr:DoxX family protein [Aureibacter tunicatorum]MDR6241334.1 putative oxidoreductase [Aureibacter tunicatorum]BDD03593.1 GntR family transcriptional regulator [Aureibacter tunicatorum]